MSKPVWKWASIGLAGAIAAAGATALNLAFEPAVAERTAATSAASAGDAGAAPPRLAAAADDGREEYRRPYIVVYREAALASYRGEQAGYPAPPRVMDPQGGKRIDMASAQAQRYADHLEERQLQHEAEMARVLGHAPRIRHRMQHAINAVVAELSQGEAARVASLPEVAFVEEYREYELDTDVGPRLIGAELLWNGTAVGGMPAVQGEGMVVGIIDSGINFGSPSFAAVDPVDGYRHVNPLGAGRYLGTCAAGGVDAGRCNDKLIGGYDFVCGVRPDPSKPDTICSLTSLYREEPGFGDTGSHGTHVASTTAGNKRNASFRGTPVRISGVAPRANIVAYDVCYTEVATERGLCPNVATLAAVNQAVADGVVDVINYSISGGTQPWSEAVSLAFLNAVDAGIYVATSAGNSGPGPFTLGHLEPWTGATAASQHGRAGFGYLLRVSGPGTVPAALQAVPLTEGSGGVAFSATLPPATPLRVSAGINAADDGCVAFPANAFRDAIAVIRRGTCAFSVKVNNAAAAGARAVVLANNQAGVVSPSVPGTTIPVFSVTQADGNAIRDFAAANGNTTTAGIAWPAVPLSNKPDVLAAFSSRGPAGMLDLVKPDVTAPGVSVLAAVSGNTLTGFETAIGLMSGTSMASPHHAGAAALVRQARPGWSVPEVKSALVMTAVQEVFKEDGVTPADPFARGGGRIQVDRAVQAGLVLHETKANYLAANPATGGDPSALNQPSLAKGACVERCEFVRTFRSTLSHRQAWSVKVEGLRAVVSPAVFVLNPGETRTVRFTIFTDNLPADDSWHFGTVVLRPQSLGNPNQPVLRMPVAVSVPSPAIALLPRATAASLPAGGNGAVSFGVANVGGSPLAFSVDNTGTGSWLWAESNSDGVSSGFRSTLYTDAGANPAAQYAADDFQVQQTTRLTTLFVEGFTVSGGSLPSTALSLNWSIFPDSGGVPAGNPLTAPTAAVWRYTAAPTAPGVFTAGEDIGLDLVAAGQNVTLPPGRYWLVVSARTAFANRWVWFGSNGGDGRFATISISSTGTGNWVASSAFNGLAMVVEGQVACGASWMTSAAPPLGRVAPGAVTPVTVRLNATGLSAGNHTGYACFASNDPYQPKVAGWVSLTVTP